jgi:hypothetical protein
VASLTQPHCREGYSEPEGWKLCLRHQRLRLRNYKLLIAQINMRAMLVAYCAVISTSKCKKREFLANCHSTTEVHYPGSVGVSVLVHWSTGTVASTGLGTVVCNPACSAETVGCVARVDSFVPHFVPMQPHLVKRACSRESLPKAMPQSICNVSGTNRASIGRSQLC